MAKIVLLTFGDSRLKKSLARIKSQALLLNRFDEIYCLTENDLDINFRKKYSSLLVVGSRGFGYWIWKPQIIKQIFDKISFGDIVLYCDCGCWINEKGIAKFDEYLLKINQSKSGILCFQIPSVKPAELSDFTYPEYVWTKGDLLDYFDVRNNLEITHSEQILATSFLMKKCENTIKFLDDWIGVWSENISLVDDSPSITKNLSGFIEHRHDQSAFSILAK